MDARTFESAKRYVGFDEDASAVLRSLHPRVARHFTAIAEDFYTAIEQDRAAAAVLKGGDAQITRLKHTLVGWLDSLLLGPHDAGFLERRSKIGQVHVRIGLPQQLMFTAMNRIRSHLSAAFHEELSDDVPKYLDAVDALNKALDLELAITLDRYRDHLTEKVRTNERLSTIGQLTASIGHELRNPLATIESSLFLASERLNALDISDAELRKHHERIALQVRYCGKTIDDLLDLARNRPPDIRRRALGPAIRRAVEETRPPPHIQTLIDVAEGLVIFADMDDLHHVLVNLLQNAVEAQPDGGRVHVTAADQKDGSEILVADDGPGIPRDVQHQIFEALFTTKPKGSGLGLALCRRIVDAHQGEIDLIERSRGACLRVWFPHRVANDERPEAASD